MKVTKSLTLVTIAAVLVFAATGCKKKLTRPTPLPGQATTTPGGDTSTPPPIGPGGIGPGPITVTPEVTPIKSGQDGFPTAKGDITGRTQDRVKFKAFTVYFEFDRSVIKKSEESNVESVASQFKAGDPATDLLIEGHCDERGTAEYNRSLGERRALAIREYLIRIGVNPEKIHTVSFGKDQPAVIGHDEGAWSKNRRGEFILVLPK